MGRFNLFLIYHHYELFDYIKFEINAQQGTLKWPARFLTPPPMGCFEIAMGKCKGPGLIRKIFIYSRGVARGGGGGA